MTLCEEIVEEEQFSIDLDVKKMIGIPPKNKNAPEEYHEYFLKKHA